MAVPSESIELQLLETATGVPTPPGEEDAQEQTVHRPSYAEHDMIQPQGIRGGREEIPNFVPYVVSVQYKWWFWWYHECGGFLVGKRTVVTAAHCFNWSIYFTKWAVVLGEHDLNKVSVSEQFIKVLSFKIHPNFNMYTGFLDGHDIALLYLSKEAVLNDFVKLAPLPPADVSLRHNTPCHFVGWGAEYRGGPPSPKLKYMKMAVVDRQTCVRQDHLGSKGAGKMDSTNFCAIGVIGNESPCKGDSGSPLTCLWKDANNTNSVFGIVSIGTCQRYGGIYWSPTMFTSIPDFIEWIHKETKKFQKMHGHGELRK